MNQSVSCNNGNGLFSCSVTRRTIPAALNCSSIPNKGTTAACLASCSEPPPSILTSLTSSVSYSATSIVSRCADRSQQTPVIVSPSCGQAESPAETATPYGAVPYVNNSYGNNEALAPAPVLQTPSFLQPYYGLSPTLSNFNVLQMCCYQPFFQEITSDGTDFSQTAESLYGFANRLHPISPSGAHHHQLTMPQAYQTRTTYVSNTVTRPTSAAAGKRGGRRPKEYEEYDHVTLSEEERDKRDKRRLRNKEAAARCRQRRIDLMGSLQNQVDQLKEENKIKETKIAELQRIKDELIAVVREHNCVLPESLRRAIDVDMSSIQQYMPRGAPTVTTTDIGQYPSAALSPNSLIPRKRPASEMIADLRTQPPPPPPLQTTLPLNDVNQANILTKVKQEPPYKTEPTLFDVNGHDLPDGGDEMKRPTSLAFTDSVATTAYNNLSSSGVPITTPSNLLGSGATDFGVNLLDGPTGLTPCHPPQATFHLSSMSTPLGEGRNFESL